MFEPKNRHLLALQAQNGQSQLSPYSALAVGFLHCLQSTPEGMALGEEEVFACIPPTLLPLITWFTTWVPPCSASSPMAGNSSSTPMLVVFGATGSGAYS